MNYDPIDDSYCKKIYTLSYIYIYIYNIQGFIKTFSKMYPPIPLRDIICSILKPRIIWINRCVSIQFSPTYLSWQSSLKSFRVTIVYVSRKETKFENNTVWETPRILFWKIESSIDRSPLPSSLHFCLINTSFFTLRFRGIESSALLLFIIR